MAVADIQEFAITDRGTTNYDFVKEKIGEGPFEGLIVHTAGFDDEAGVFRILDVWETREHADRFLAEHVQPLIDEGPSAFPNPAAFAIPTRDGFYDLHDVCSRHSRITEAPLGRGPPARIAPDPANRYRFIRIATSYFETDVRSPGVSSRGIESRISLPRT